jgi:hypothetical protein
MMAKRRWPKPMRPSCENQAALLFVHMLTDADEFCPIRRSGRVMVRVNACDATHVEMLLAKIEICAARS